MTCPTEAKHITWLDRPLFGRWQITLEVMIYALLVIVSIVACFYDLGSRTFSHDECVHGLYSRELYVGQGFEHDPWRHGPFLYHINAFFYFLFGVSDFTARISTALFGVSLVIWPIFLRKELGRVGALAVSTMMLVSPSMLYYARYLRDDVYMVVWAMLMTVALFRYFDSHHPRWLYLGAFAVSMALCTMENSLMTGFIGATFLAMLFVRQVLGPRTRQVLSIVALVLLMLLLLLAAGLLSDETSAAAPKLLELLVLPIGTLIALLFSAALVEPGEQPNAAVRSVTAYALGIAALFVLCGATGGLFWLLVAQMPAGVVSPAVFLILQFLSAALGISIGGYAWWRWMLKVQRKNWLPEGFDFRVLYIILAAAVIPFVLLYTTFFTNPKGLISGTVGAVSYWLAQQAVKRGGQPWWYYGMIAGLYDWLPLGLSVLGAAVYTIRSARRTFVAYCIYWSLMAWLLYSWAGERMPWLVVHITQPMILLAGRFVNDVAGRLCAHPRLRTAFLTLFVLGGILTARYAILAVYINGDTAKEFLVYSHGAPGAKQTVEEIRRISRRLYGDEQEIRVAYGSDGTCPFEWYFVQNFPNRVFFGTEPTRETTNAPVLVVGYPEVDKVEPFLGKRYIRFNRKYLWFPHQDYYMTVSFLVPPEEKRDPSKNYFWLDMRDPEKRRAFLDVLLYRKYDQTLADWEPSYPGKFAFYVRKDIAAQMWDRTALSAQPE